ncbi:hypothetical protein [Microbacterium indicum]|uniref:hypothetical protein n=1 Tax=Microbacterium indicum TaxID=358100 RepID=UPI0004008EFF|nr:hypothetical protein [Microbacterium indicum]
MIPDAWRAAVFEGDGALLWWDLATGVSGADVWDDARAAAWIELPREPMRRAALAAWREAWWPASRIAGIEPVDRRALAAERALAAAALDGIADDDEATERALRDLARLGPWEDERIRELADDYGLADAAAEEAAARQEAYALAAAGEAARAPLQSGESPVDPGAVPQGVVDPAGRIAWSIAFGAAGPTIRVSVPAAPGDERAAALTAHVAGVDVPLARSGERWAGEAAAPATVLAAAGHEASLTAEGFAPIPGVDLEVLLRIAREWPR